MSRNPLPNRAVLKRSGVLLLVPALAAALALGACGRRGSGEAPVTIETMPMVDRFPHDPGTDEVPDRKFVLDPILQ